MQKAIGFEDRGRAVGRRVAQEPGAVGFRASQVDCLGKQDKHNGGRYSAGLVAGPAPTSPGVTIPNSPNSPHVRWSMRMVPAMVFLSGYLSIT